MLGVLTGDERQPVAPSSCVVDSAWTDSYLTTPPTLDAGCEDYPLTGYDSEFGNRWWVVLNRDAELALIGQ